MRHRSGRIWSGRVVAVAVLAALIGYFWTVGLDKADNIAVVLTLFVAAISLAAPYLLPASAGATPAQAAVPVAAPSITATVNGGHFGQARDTGGKGDKVVSDVAASPTSAGESKAGWADKDRWIAAVMAFTDIEDPEFRRAVLRLMGDRLELGHAFSASYRPVARDHVFEIVDRCWAFKDPPDAARRALADSLISLRPDDRGVGLLKLLPGGE